MRRYSLFLALALIGWLPLATATPSSADQSGRVAKRAAKEATKDAAGDAAKDATKGAVKKAAAPDAVDLNTASTEQLTKLGLDEATQKKLVDGRPYSGLDDAKLKEAVSGDVMKKLEGKVVVKPVAK
jgi:DNA uptake protein ComE-like DNA-binding protein